MPAPAERPPCPSDGRTHGTLTAYTSGKCRGESCAQAMRDYHAKWWEAHRDERNAKWRTMYAENRSAQSARKAAEYVRGREEILARNAEWARANPEKRRASTHRRRARQAGADHGCVTSEFMAALYESPCVYCGATEDITADHVQPLSRSGLHCVENLQAACGSCNYRKWANPTSLAPAPRARCLKNNPGEA